MRISKALLITTIAIFSMVVFSVAKPVLSYQFGQNPQLTNEASSLTAPGMLLAERGCNGASRARDSLQSALDALEDVRDEGIHLRRALQATRTGLIEIRAHIAQKNC